MRSIRPTVVGAPLVITLALLAVFGFLSLPGPYGFVQFDSFDYAYGALALLHGTYLVEWPGMAAHIPRYAPGFSLLLAPAVALGGIQAAVWVPYLCALALGLLVAYLAALVGRPLAAPWAVATVLCGAAQTTFARLVMSDLPAATLGVAQIAVLARAHTARAALFGGLLAGALIWVRPASIVLGLAGLGGLTARPGWRRLAVGYAIGLCLPLAALGAWQWLTFGSPLTSGYEAAAAGPGGRGDLAALFSAQYVFGQPWRSDGAVLGGGAAGWKLPNAAVYPLQLAGMDAFLSLPGVGLVGLFGLVRLARRQGAGGVVGRFGLLAVLLTLLVYIPYFWQSGRFLLLPAAVLGLAAATLVAEGNAALARRLGRQRRLRQPTS